MACGRTTRASTLSVARCGAFLLSVFVLPLFWGCVTTVPQSRIDHSSNEEIPKGEAVVFGRAKVERDNKVLIWKAEPKVVSIVIYQFRPQFFMVFIKEEATKKEFVYRLVGDGSFSWRLPPGAYSITGYYYNPGATHVESHFAPGLTPGFVVSEGDSAVYIGTLSIDLHPTGSDVMEIVDEYDQSLPALKSRFPRLAAWAKKGLMSFH